MSARGPDGAGLWWGPGRRLGLGHRRLSIIDLDARAGQPMASADSQLTIVFNGEIYNHPELRAELEAQGAVYRTSSDTETLLHLYRRDGVEMLGRLRGMFAFAIFDARRNGVLLARDPYGIKPLYYANDGWTYRFASQVKALMAGGAISSEPEPAGTVGFLLQGSVPEPFTLYRDIRALPAGHSQWVDEAGPREPRAFASLASVLAKARGAEPQDRQGGVRRAALESVSAHLLADVEVGLFLSAGIDSSALLGLMRDAGQAQVRCITLGFDEFVGTPEDEAPLAAEVARFYGAEHHVRRVGETEFNADLPALLAAMDQPSIDGVNTWFVSKAAREAGLKVALSGLGGDELLGGYPSFREIPRWVGRLSLPAKIPGAGPMVRLAMRSLMRDRVAAQPKLAGMLEYGGTYPGAYLLRRGLFLPFELGEIMDPALLRQGLNRLDWRSRIGAAMTPDPGSPNGRVCALESSVYMRHQLLRDADWAGMAHSLEIRTPLVDFTLVQTLAPLVHGLKAGEGKALLAASPSRPLPDAIAKRAKTGFVVPTGAWRGRALEQSGYKSGASKGAVSRLWAREVLSRQAPAPAPLSVAA